MEQDNKPESVARSTTKIPMPVLEVLARGSGSVPQRRLADRYELRGVIGGGGMADVFEARDHELDRDVAIKMLRRGPSVDVADVARFRREAQVLANVHNDRLVEIFDAHIAPDACYLVLRLVAGTTARKLVEREGPLGVRAAIAVTLDVLDALAALHAHDVVHRDIKPSNVMIGDDGHATVIDLGVAQDRKRGDLTAFHQTVGTPPFMSPELRKSARVDARSDLYQVATLLRFLATSIEPSCVPVDLRDRMPAEVAAVIDRGMAEHAQRYHSAEEMAEALRAASGERAPVRPRQRGHKLAIGVAGLLVAAAAMLASLRPRAAIASTSADVAFAPSAELTSMHVVALAYEPAIPTIIEMPVTPVHAEPAPADTDAPSDRAMPVLYRALADEDAGERDAAITGYFAYLTMVSHGPAADVARAHLANLVR